MIVCPFKDLNRYAAILPGLEEVLQAVAEMTDFTPRTIPLSGSNKILVQQGTTKDAATQQVEAHRDFLDIQYLVKGEEIVGWAPTETLTPANIDAVREMAAKWYEARLAHDPQADFHLEQRALRRALDRFEVLGLEGMVLYDGDRVIAFSIASQLSTDTMDVHFEKALEDVDGAYTAINQAFAQHLRDKHLHIRYLDREEDMGIEGLRKAKLSYCPDHLTEKYWARLWEESDEH